MKNLKEHIAENLSEQKIDEISILHKLLNSEFKEEAVKPMKEFEELSTTVKIPPLIKNFSDKKEYILPKNFIEIPHSLEKVLKSRRSIRDYALENLSTEELSTILYYSYGIRKYMPAYNLREFPFRMAPTTGGLQAVDLYIIVNRVSDLKKGLYYFNPFKHSLIYLQEGNFSRKLVNICAFQEFVYYASANIILVGTLQRLLWKYKVKAYRYLHMDAGFIAENIYLITIGLRLGCCAIAGFFDDLLSELCQIDGKYEFPLLVISMGKRVKKK